MSLKKKITDSLTILGLVLIGISWSFASRAQDAPEPKHYTQNQIKNIVQSLTEIKLHSGINNVELKGISMQGQITVAYMQYGSTGSHNLFLITVQDDDYDSPGTWFIIPTGNNEDETVDDAPNDGEITNKSFRLFNASIQGQPETLLMISSINGDPMENPASATISVQELRSTGDFPPFEFRPVLEFKTSQTYVNADVALLRELGVPKPGS